MVLAEVFMRGRKIGRGDEKEPVLGLLEKALELEVKSSPLYRV
jgi:hypothetical protein